MDDTSIAWAAGFLDGEGCFYVARNKGDNRKRATYSTAISTCQKVKEPLNRLKLILGGSIRLSTNGTYLWRLQEAQEVAAVCERLIPFLSLKKPQAELLVEYQTEFHHLYKRTRSDEQIKRQEDLFNKSKRLKYTG